MSYELFVLRRAQKELADLSKTDFERVRDAVVALAQNPRPVGCKKLVGRDGWRIRSGDYRVIYTIFDAVLIVAIEGIRHRREVYR